MKKLIGRILTVIAVLVVLTFIGCGDGGKGGLFGLEDRLIKTEVEKLVTQHFTQQEDLIKMYTIEKCLDYVIGPEVKGARKGSINLCLKNKKTGELKKLAYEFTYENDVISAGVKDPSQALELMGLGGLANLAKLGESLGGADDNNKAEKVLGLDKAKLSDALADLDAAGKMMENFKNLSFSQIEVVEKLSGIVTKKIQAEWLPQLHAKAKRLGVKEFSVELDEEDGVVLLPDDKTGSKYSGLVSGKAKADGDEAEFAFRLEVNVVNGNVTYEVKQ